MRSAYTIWGDDENGISTGCSATDRARTTRLLGDPNAEADDLVRPGHVFPLRYRRGGVLRRAGHTEAAVDLARLAKLGPAGGLAEGENHERAAARVPGISRFSREICP